MGGSAGRSVDSGGWRGDACAEVDGDVDREAVVDGEARAIDEPAPIDEPTTGVSGRLVAGRADAATSMAMKSSARTRRATSTDVRAREAGIERTVAAPASVGSGPKVPA